MANLSGEQKKLVIQLSLTILPNVVDYTKDPKGCIRDSTQGRRVLASFQKQGISLEDVNRYFGEKKN